MFVIVSWLSWSVFVTVTVAAVFFCSLIKRVVLERNRKKKHFKGRMHQRMRCMAIEHVKYIQFIYKIYMNFSIIFFFASNNGVESSGTGMQYNNNNGSNNKMMHWEYKKRREKQFIWCEMHLLTSLKCCIYAVVWRIGMMIGS